MIFFAYFLFYLPNASINPQDLTQYNWLNQSLIEFKITVKDLIINLLSNPTNPGTPPTAPASLPSTVILDTISPVASTHYVSGSSAGTITPTCLSKSSYLKTVTESSTQTIIDGKTVGKMVETVKVLSTALKVDEASMITDHAAARGE